MRELSLHILDIIENSIEAGASLIELTINEDIINNKLLINIRDDGRGMSERQQKNAVEPFCTSRTTRDVGLGIPLFKEASRQCNGELQLKSRPGKGTVITAEFEYNHIDRAPLGNIPATITAFITTNPELELKYKHIYNKKKFIFTTESIRRELKDLPPGHPEVIEWIKNYLENELEKLRGGE